MLPGGPARHLPALNQRTTEGFEGWLEEIEVRLAGAPRCRALRRQPDRPQEHPRVGDLARIVAHRVPLVITSLGAVASVVEAVRSYGGLVSSRCRQCAPCRKGGGRRRGRADRGGAGRAAMPARSAPSFCARFRDTELLRRAAGAGGRDQRRAATSPLHDDGCGPRLSRVRISSPRGKARRRCAEGR